MAKVEMAAVMEQAMAAAMAATEEAYNKALFSSYLELAPTETRVEMVEDEYYKYPETLDEFQNAIDVETDDNMMMVLMDDEMELLDADFFVVPNKEKRRRTRKDNRTHKTMCKYGKTVKTYGKGKKHERAYLYDKMNIGGKLIKDLKDSEKLAFNLNDKEQFVDQFNTAVTAVVCPEEKCYRTIKVRHGRDEEWMAFPANYRTLAETKKQIIADELSCKGVSNTFADIELACRAYPTDDGIGKLIAKIFINYVLAWEGDDIEHAKRLFDDLTK